MPRYRCFCLTSDGRIITGAFIEAASVAAAVQHAIQRWRNVPGADRAEVWLGHKLLVPASPWFDLALAHSAYDARSPELHSSMCAQPVRGESPDQRPERIPGGVNVLAGYPA